MQRALHLRGSLLDINLPSGLRRRQQKIRRHDPDADGPNAMAS